MNELSKIINKKNYYQMYSGTLAFECALKYLQLENKSNVLISSSVCYSLILTIIRCGLTPVIVNPKNSFTITLDESLEIINKYNIKCFVLVHQYGLGQEIKKFKDNFPNIPIIEDVAQAWNIELDKENTFEYSDIIITSFGRTKPLSLGFGGAIFTDYEIDSIIDYYDNNSRNIKKEMLPYYLNCIINYKKLVNIGNKNVIYQRKIANCLNKINNSNLKLIKEEGKYVYHRFPIVCSSRKVFDNLIKLLDNENVLYQFSHELDVYDIPSIKGKCIIVNQKRKEYLVLIKTRQNKIRNIKRVVNIINKEW